MPKTLILFLSRRRCAGKTRPSNGLLRMERVLLRSVRGHSGGKGTARIGRNPIDWIENARVRALSPIVRLSRKAQSGRQKYWIAKGRAHPCQRPVRALSAPARERRSDFSVSGCGSGECPPVPVARPGNRLDDLIRRPSPAPAPFSRLPAAPSEAAGWQIIRPQSRSGFQDRPASAGQVRARRRS